LTGINHFKPLPLFSQNYIRLLFGSYAMQKSVPARILSTTLFGLGFMFAILACDFSSALPTAIAPLLLPPVASETAAPAQPGGLTEIPMQVGYGARGSFFEIYFTDPLNPNAYKQVNGPDIPLAQAIDQARISVDVAAYSLSLYSIQSALTRAQSRGVVVRMVMETDNMGDRAPQALLAAGIPIIGDRRQGLMHDKFVVIDRSEVWTGSMNFTTSGTYDDNNNLVRIRSTKVAEDYTVEFEEMFKEDFFGPDAIAATPNPRVTIDGVPVEIYFSPDDHVATRIVQLLRGARESIYFLAYSFTADDFGLVLRQKDQQGLTVEGVMEQDQVKTNQGTEFAAFQHARMSVYTDGNPALMHHKVFIIDRSIVITGSYNFTASAENTNDENVVIFFDPRIAAQYLAEFQRVEAQAQK
jgi:phosphatidylserine/phosphatidylglycerophosphate/cardiolipin synthase-like enzyme